ncbi:MAG: type II toxin-antitoxin system RelE family toxin [Fusobacterium sp.]
MKLIFKYKKIAEKFLNKHKGLKEKFQENITLAYNGYKNIDIGIVEGQEIKTYRMRITSYRIIFRVEEDNTLTIIDVIDAGNRGDIYKRY